MQSSRVHTLGLNALSTAFSGALGVGCTVVVDALVLAFFGLGWMSDAYFLATTVPLTLTTALTAQAWVVVQPLFIHEREKTGERAGWRVLNLIITTSAMIVFILGMVGVLLSPIVIRTQAPGFAGPALIEALGFPRAALGLVFGAGNLGLMAGAVILGILGDRAGRSRR